ncbi:MAG: DUF535 family protein, partial [Acetobacteraceae bacterium]|nr:DUF535 family protein [Acetobacteraceae bacterium]
KIDVRGKVGRRARQLGYVLAHPLRHWRLQRLIAAAQRKGVAAPDRSIGWKYLGEYLAGDLSTADRARLIGSHYRFLLRRLPEEALRRAWARGLRLWERQVGEDAYVIRLAQSTFSAMEGETQLSFFRNEARLFTLTFALVGGRALGLAYDSAMFIGGMQGGYQCRHTNRLAARDNGEIAPSAMVVIAARAVAQMLGIDQIAAVSSGRQAAAAYAGGKIRFSYDDHWRQLGSDRFTNGFFLVDPSPASRNLDHLSPAHRARARRKARLKNALAAEMQHNLERQLQAAR